MCYGHAALSSQGINCSTGVVWIIVMCLSDSHYDGTHSLQSMHCWDTDAFLQIGSDDQTISSTLCLAWVHYLDWSKWFMIQKSMFDFRDSCICISRIRNHCIKKRSECLHPYYLAFLRCGQFNTQVSHCSLWGSEPARPTVITIALLLYALNESRDLGRQQLISFPTQIQPDLTR